jgi:iron complex transport system ATP-binding protein
MNLIANNITYSVKKKTLIENVSISVAPNEFVAILGANGAGKSTLLKCLAGELAATGKIQINGKAIEQWSAKELARIRAVLPQTNQLGFAFNVRDVVMFGRHPYRDDRHQDNQSQIVMKMLDLVGAAHLAERAFPTLSGGEKARVQCARVLAQLCTDEQTQRTLMLDEPTASLDLKHQVSVLSAAKAFSEQQRCATVAVLHDVNLAARFATRVVWLKQGEVIADGSVEAMINVEWIQRVYGVTTVMMRHPTLNYPISMAV